MVGDSLIAVHLLLMDLTILVAARFDPTGAMPPWYVAVPVDIAVVLPVVFRRKHPLWAGYAALLTGAVHAALELGFASVFTSGIAVYSVVVYARRRPAALFVTVVLVVSAVHLLLQFREDWLALAISTVLLIAFCWLLGEFVGARRAYQAEVEARLHLLETERDQATRIAVAEERGRIARELHDVVAHAVSVIVVQADGASYTLRSDPDVAERAVRTISATGRAALAELRRLLEVLRDDGSGDSGGQPRVPQPGADALAELADRVRAAGLPVRLDVDGDLGDLPAGVSLGIYRIVQESLTNTLKHAGRDAATTVRVCRRDDVVEVDVSDDGAGRARALVPEGATAVPGGNGLIGMRERANVLGGTLDVGPAPGGGWRVRASLPLVKETESWHRTATD
nr:sensor histidine kinase [Amycolatopsis arida]